MPSGLERYAHRIWRTKGLVSTLLLPLAWVVRLLVNEKTRRYRDPARQWHPGVPVIVVGNIYVGGTGKTPVVMALVQGLRSAGWYPGVISRGYGSRPQDRLRVGRGQLDAHEYGDEPALIARMTNAPVAVHPQRRRAAEALLKEFPEVNVIVSDDGLQHLALARDCEIIVQDSRGVGNGRLLPAGPLREPVARLGTVDFVIIHYTGTNEESCKQPAEPAAQAPAEPPLAAQGRPHRLSMVLEPVAARHLATHKLTAWSEWIVQYQDHAVAALAGIGHPERFFGMLRRQGLDVRQTLALPDHGMAPADALKALTAPIVLMTAKDAVKYAGANDPRLWAVEVAPRFSDPDWVADVMACIAAGRDGAPASPRT